MINGLSACVGSARRSIESEAVKAGDRARGRWLAGRWCPNRLADAAEAAIKLDSLVLEEVAQMEADTNAWGGPCAARNSDDATCALSSSVGSSGAAHPALELQVHLLSRSTGVIGSYGAALPLVRTMGWLHSTLLAADLDGGASADTRGWIEAHATRWTALADACEATFDLARQALDDGADLSRGGALSDVECAVALREAQTTASLLHEVFAEVEARQGAAEGAGDSEDAALVLEAARAALARVEVDYVVVGAEDGEHAGQARAEGAAPSAPAAVFVRGRGFLDESGQQNARREAADSYRRAKESAAARVIE